MFRVKSIKHADGKPRRNAKGGAKGKKSSGSSPSKKRAGHMSEKSSQWKQSKGLQEGHSAPLREPDQPWESPVKSVTPTGKKLPQSWSSLVKEQRDSSSAHPSPVAESREEMPITREETQRLGLKEVAREQSSSASIDTNQSNIEIVAMTNSAGHNVTRIMAPKAGGPSKSKMVEQHKEAEAMQSNQKVSGQSKKSKKGFFWNRKKQNKKDDKGVILKADNKAAPSSNRTEKYIGKSGMENQNYSLSLVRSFEQKYQARRQPMHGENVTGRPENSAETLLSEPPSGSANVQKVITLSPKASSGSAVPKWSTPKIRTFADDGENSESRNSRDFIESKLSIEPEGIDGAQLVPEPVSSAVDDVHSGKKNSASQVQNNAAAEGGIFSMFASTMNSFLYPATGNSQPHETAEVSPTVTPHFGERDQATLRGIPRHAHSADTGDTSTANERVLNDVYSADANELLSEATSSVDSIGLQASSTESVPEVSRMITEVLNSRKEDVVDFIRAPSRQRNPPTQSWSAQVANWKEKHQDADHAREAPGSRFEQTAEYHADEADFDDEPSFDESEASESYPSYQSVEESSRNDYSSYADSSYNNISRDSRASYSTPKERSNRGRTPRVVSGKWMYQRRDGSVASSPSRAHSEYSEPESFASSSVQSLRMRRKYEKRRLLQKDPSEDDSDESSEDSSESSSEEDDEYDDYDESKAIDTSTLRDLMEEANAMDSKLIEESASEESVSNVDEAIAILRLHAERLGVDERDLLDAIERGIVIDDQDDL